MTKTNEIIIKRMTNESAIILNQNGVPQLNQVITKDEQNLKILKVVLQPYLFYFIYINSEANSNRTSVNDMVAEL